MMCHDITRRSSIILRISLYYYVQPLSLRSKLCLLVVHQACVGDCHVIHSRYICNSLEVCIFPQTPSLEDLFNGIRYSNQMTCMHRKSIKVHQLSCVSWENTTTINRLLIVHTHPTPSMYSKVDHFNEYMQPAQKLC